jgi:transposase
MACIVKNKVGNNTYLYESVSYRDKHGKPQNKRVIIGKLDPKTGQHRYKQEYLEKMVSEGTPVPIDPPVSFSVQDIQSSCIKELGAFYLYTQIAEKTGLREVLQNIFPTKWQSIFDLACFLVSTGEPFMYGEDWLSKTEGYPEYLSSSAISALLQSIGHQDQEQFFSAWAKCRSEQEYLALDITSISSYSELIDDVAWGYNRDGEKLPQVNLCMLLGETSRLPVFQMLYNGSLKDVSTLKTTLSLACAIQQNRLTLVMDKGFFSKKNVKDLLEGPLQSRFIISLPFTVGFAKEQVERERARIDSPENTLVLGEQVLRGVTRKQIASFIPGSTQEVYTHIYYNLTKADEAKNSLYGYVVSLVELAKGDAEDPRYADEFKKYLVIEKSEKTGRVTITIRHEVIEHKLSHVGWMILISNDIASAQEALRMYRSKDVVEKGFMRLKNNLDLNRLRIHRDTAMRSKVFIGFIALVLMSYIHNVMLNAGLYKNLTVKELIRHLEKIRVQYIAGNRILFPLTKMQKNIFSAFHIISPS